MLRIVLLSLFIISNITESSAAEKISLSQQEATAASATVGLLGREGATLRKTILPTMYYLIITGLIGMIAIYVIGMTDALTVVK